MRRNSLHTSDLEAHILKRVRASSGASRVDLARALGMAPSTAGIYVERLIEGGYLAETDKATREAGRPPILLNLNPQAGEFVGVDFEARNIMAVAVDFSDKPLRNAHTQIAETDSVDEITRKIEQTIARVLPSDPKRLLAIGVGVPGLVNSAQGIAIYYEYIANWKNIPLGRHLEERFRAPVYLENCVRSMALAELWFGQGLDINDFLCIGIRSGIGAGMILNGRLYSGAYHSAGEFGHWHCPVVSGKAAAWFAADAAKTPFAPELQEVASVRAILRALGKAIASGEKTILSDRSGSLTFQDVIQAMQQRDPLTLLIISEAAKCLGWAIGQLVLVLDPKKVVLAGPLTLLGENILQPLRAVADSIILSEGSKPAEIVNSTMGEFSGALGAAALAVNEWKPADRQRREAAGFVAPAAAGGGAVRSAP